MLGLRWFVRQRPSPPPARAPLSREPGSRAACRAQRLRDRADVAEDLTEWRELLVEAERLGGPLTEPTDERSRDER